MSMSISTAAKNANSMRAVLGSEKAETGITQQIVMNVLKALRGSKTWALAGDLLGLTEATAKHRMAGAREFSIDELRTLLRSEHGRDFLVAIMAGSDAAWWNVLRPMLELADVQRMQLRARRKINKALEEAIHADDDLSCAIRRAESALAVQDEDFAGPHLDALRAMRGHPRGAMATAKQRRR